MRSFPGLCSSEVVLRNTFVYMGSDDGVLHVVRQRDGKTKWTYRSGRTGLTAPTVAHGKVWLAISDGSLHALDAFSGKKLWAHEPKLGSAQPNRMGLFPGPAILRGRVYQREGRNVVAVSQTSGRTITSLALPRGDLTNPMSTGKSIVIGVEKQLYSINAGLDSVLWRADLNEEGPTTPVAFGSRLFVGTRRGLVFALDAVTGRILWRYGELPASVTGVSADGSLVFAATANGNVYALDAESGRLRWRFDTDGSFVSPTATSGGSVLFGSNDGNLYSLVSETGAFEWSYDTEDSYVGSLAVQDDVVYFGANLPSDAGGTTQLTSFDVSRVLSGVVAFSGGPVHGRLRPQDTASTVLVDGAVTATQRVGSRGGLWTPLAWPLRFLSAMGNPNSLLRREPLGGRSRAADSLSLAAATQGLTAGPVAWFVFIAAFGLSVLGSATAPQTVAILGKTAPVSVASRPPRARLIRESLRHVRRSPWMLGVAYGVQFAVLPVFMAMRLFAGRTDSSIAFLMWTGLSGLVATTASASVRITLLRGAAMEMDGGRFSVSGCRPRAVTMYRVTTLYLLLALAMVVCFALVELAGVLEVGWLLVPSVIAWVACAPGLLADYHIAAEECSLPRGFLAGARSIARRPHWAVAYVATAGAAILAPAALGASAGEVWGLAAGLAVCPFVGCVLAVAAAEICARTGPLFPLQGTAGLLASSAASADPVNPKGT